MPYPKQQDGQIQPQQQVLSLVVQIWEQGKERVFARINLLEEAVIQLMSGQLDLELRREAEREAHKLAGSLTTFGLPEGSRLARDLEVVFQGELPLEPKTALSLSEKVLSLRQVVAAGAHWDVEPTEQPVQATHYSLLIIDDGPDLAARLSEDAPAKGIETQGVVSLSAARQALSQRAWDAVLLNLPHLGAKAECLNLIRDLSSKEPPTPVLVRSSLDAAWERVQLAQAGASRFFPTSLSPNQLLEAVSEFLERAQSLAARVIAVDDDEDILALLEGILGAAGSQVLSVSDPLQFWQALEDESPDLVILDVDMPNASGIELCKTIRSDPRWSALPVIFLTSHKDSETIQRIFQAGADDYIPKPVLGKELITRVGNRLERTRLLRDSGEIDALTGLYRKEKLGREMEWLRARAHSSKQPFSVAVVELDGLDRVMEVHGKTVVDTVLRKVSQLFPAFLGIEDVAGRWASGGLVVGMYEADKWEAVARLTGLCKSVAQEALVDSEGEAFKVTCSIGAAEYPVDGQDVAALVKAAQEVCLQAQSLGGDQALANGWRQNLENPREKVDVLLVDDDETMASLLLHALANRGHSTYWLQDGLEAAEALGGETPTLEASLVLLDVDIPGLDGIGVLRRWAREGILDRTRVIMLTRRTVEEEVLACLELGAFDHVSKPFSVPILLQRIKGALKVSK